MLCKELTITKKVKAPPTQPFNKMQLQIDDFQNFNNVNQMNQIDWFELDPMPQSATVAILTTATVFNK